MSTQGPDEMRDGAAPGPGTALVFERLPEWGEADSLATEQVDDMVAAWRKGERRVAEDYLHRHPELSDEAAIRLIYEEYCLRQEAGLDPDPLEIAGRFPQWQAELELLFDCHRMLEPSPQPPNMPAVGETFAGFHLLAELGHGIAGSVFLATQPDLADRPVALKVTPRGREEHLSLAQLQHMNIVPLYAAQVIHERNLQVLCMPFLGGASLALVLERISRVPVTKRTGRHLLDAIDDVQSRLPASAPFKGPVRQFLARASYVEAICWIGACLADGLQYAHERNVLHLDIKPSNVLLAGDGQPMLLDFHVARGRIAAGGPRPGWMGGTLDYMPPEQRAALDAVLEGRPVEQPVDGRADLYSLALLLYEALGGLLSAARQQAPVPLSRANADVSLGLADIIEKCLQPNPNDRYPTAAALAADLKRHLNDLPLRGVRTRSVRERYRKWRRRSPAALHRAVVVGVSAAILFAAVPLMAIGYRQRVEEINSALLSGRALLFQGRYSEAKSVLQSGLRLCAYMPGVEVSKRELTSVLARAERDARAVELHRIADLIRFRYGIDPPPYAEAQSLIERGRALWGARASLLQPVAGEDETALDRQIRTDLHDLALAWAELRTRTASPAEAEKARGEAIEMLDQASAVLGASPAIVRDRPALGEASGSGTPSTELPFSAHSAWQHYDLGRSYLRSGQIDQAAKEFQLGLAKRPQDFWLNFYAGLCAYRLANYEEAVNAFRVCIALAPETAECSYNRAMAYRALGRRDEATRDYTRALELNPGLTEAALNRGILRYEQGDFAGATADLERALATTSDRAKRGTINYNLALVYRASGDRSAAASKLAAAIELGNQDARELNERPSR
jgi:serine/threonine protein kinase/Tfp pilus assembly protein PilF